MAWSLNSRCYPRSKQAAAAAAAAARSMSWMVTQRRCFAPDAQPTIGGPLRRQTTVGWRGLGPRDEGKRTRRAPLRTRRFYSSSSSSTQSTLGCFVVSKYKIPRQVDSSALGASPPDRRQPAWLRTLGFYTQYSALGASLRGARPQQQQLVSPFVQISARTTNPCFLA